jgi:hypothetical protein
MSYKPQILAIADGGNGNNVGATSGNLVLISSQVASNTAALTFTTGITNAYDVYKLVYYGVLPVSGATPTLNLQISTNGGSSYINTGYAAYDSFSYAAGIVQSQATASGAAGFIIGNSTDNTSNVPCAGFAYLYNLTNSSYYKFCQRFNTGFFSGGLFSAAGAGSYPSTTNVNALQVVMSTGNISTGTFKLYGITN